MVTPLALAQLGDPSGSGQAGTESQSPAPTATEPSAPTPSRATPATAAPSAMTPPGSLKQGAGSPSLRLPAGIPPAPRRPDPAQLRQAKPQSFDRALDQLDLDQLVRDRTVSPAERARVRSAGVLQPGAPLAHRKACAAGALSASECRGVQVRWPGGSGPLAAGSGDETGSGFAAGGFAGGGAVAGLTPLPPLTVPVSALLTGAGGSFRLTDVFRVTPRPAPLAGNGNRSLLFPLIGSAVTSSDFGWRLHPVLGSWLMHAGRDLAAPEGTPVVAALSGRVVSSGLAGGYGLAVELEHQSPKRRTLYGHLSELFVKEGEWVEQGTVIGRVGSTGLSTGPHLHFELRQPENGGWVAVDPGELDPGRNLAAGSDAIALLMGQLLESLERSQALPKPKSSPAEAG
ncbi:M23 family metallopeptidase [Synechococcus sp. CS-603]|nr:M23 family metallopeptidase [Synechococcus sp. CS-603]MCT0202625.1 M23 family metallopeptidase [Synechococcus sp. CS-603]